MNSLPCDIVIIPDADISARAITLSEHLGRGETYFTLKEGKYFPHTSLYMAQLDMSRLDEIKERLSDVAAHTPKISLSPKKYHQQWGYVDVEYERDTIIDKLQMDIVHAINPIRDGLRQKDIDRLPEEVGIERENILTYGYRSVGEKFAPHITITRFTDRNDIDLTTLPDVSTFQATYSKIGLFEMGENGTCVRKIAEFNLG
jgi:2'-5' RNA ligase